MVNKRISISVSPSGYDLLKRWGKFHGRSPAELAAQIVSNQVESNLDLILKLEQSGVIIDSDSDIEAEE